jgi:hypothetical protein
MPPSIAECALRVVAHSSKVSKTRDSNRLMPERLRVSGRGLLEAFAPPTLSELVAPVIGSSATALYSGGRATPPAQVVYHYEHVEWELFIREWATGLNDHYVQIKRLGGANDHGVDVAAFKTPQGFEGPWDCFQGKHYSRPLSESDVFPEMLKLFVNAIRGHFVLPDAYKFLAPQGCSGSLEKLLSRPTSMKARFSKRMGESKALVKGLDSSEIAAISKLANATDFSMFASVQFEDMLNVHKSTDYYPIRFGAPLNPRPAAAPIPMEFLSVEAVYVQQLVNVYKEKYPGTALSAQNVASHKLTSTHFQRQRVTFFQAEALRKFAESSVPPGTFGKLQDDVRSGVVDAAERPHGSAFDRLATVLSASVGLNLSAHVLMSVGDNRDVLGICHQLANSSRLFWDQEAQG